MVRIRYYIAECQYYNGKIEEAYQSCLEGGHSLFYCQNCEEEAKYYNLIGLIYSQSKKELKALKYYIRGIDYAEEYNMQGMLGVFYNNIADLYERLGNHESAMRYFKKSIAIYNKVEEKKSIKAVVYINIAASYCMMKNYIEAEKYYVCSETYFKKEIKNQKYYELSLLSVKCMIELGQKKNQLALECFEKIVVLVKQKTLYRNNFRYIIAICQHMIELRYGERIINFYSYIRRKKQPY